MSDTIGTMLGTWGIEAKLGRGGVAVVRRLYPDTFAGQGVRGRFGSAEDPAAVRDMVQAGVDDTKTEAGGDT